MKLLWIGDAVAQSGFSVVTHNICNELYKKCDLAVYGIRYEGVNKNPYPYHIYPAQTPGDMYNFNRVGNVVRNENPDVIIIFNDDHIIRRFLDSIPLANAQIIPLFPVNLLPVDVPNMLAFSDPKFGITDVMTYTKFSKKRIQGVNPNIDVTAIYHGVNKNVFFPIKEAKKSLNLEGYFVAGNVNGNTYRKRLDLFLIGFAKFAKGKDDVRCLVHCGVSAKQGYNLAKIATDLGIGNKLILSQSKINLAEMNLLYNVMDVNVSTPIGEGFGLSLIEGAACGAPILCPKHGNLTDIWGDNAEFINIDRQEYVPGTNYIADVISTDDLADKLNKFYTDKEFTKEKKMQAFKHSKNQKFNWKIVARKVFNVITKSYRNKSNIVVRQNVG